jgi:hypothetical protein
MMVQWEKITTKSIYYVKLENCFKIVEKILADGKKTPIMVCGLGNLKGKKPQQCENIDFFTRGQRTKI